MDYSSDGSLDGSASSPEKKKRHESSVRALREALPSITKMDEASVIRDAVSYIKKLREQEKKMEAELLAMESGDFTGKPEVHVDDEALVPGKNPPPSSNSGDSSGAGESVSFPVEILDLNVNYIGEKVAMVSLTCTNRADTAWKVSRVIESLNLNIRTSSIHAHANKLSTTLFIEVEEGKKEDIVRTIETAIAAVSSDCPSP